MVKLNVRLIAVLVMIVAIFCLLAAVVFAENNKTIFQIDSVMVYKIVDGNTVCYLAKGDQKTSDFFITGDFVSISCVRTR